MTAKPASFIGGHFCVLCIFQLQLQLRRLWARQQPHRKFLKLSSLQSPSFLLDFHMDFYLNRGSQSLWRGLTAYRFWQHLCLNDIISSRTYVCNIRSYLFWYIGMYKELSALPVKKNKWLTSSLMKWIICPTLSHLSGNREPPFRTERSHYSDCYGAIRLLLYKFLYTVCMRQWRKYI